MKNSQNQNSPNVQKDAVQYKSPTFLIQLGLVLALLMAYVAIEFKSYATPTVVDYIPKTKPVEEENPPVIIEKQVEPEKQLVKQPVDINKIEILNNNNPEGESILNPKDFDPDKKPEIIDLSKIKSVIEVEPIIENVPFKSVENAPVFPGCVGNETEIKKCFSEKVTRYVNSNFDVSVAEELNIEGKQKIQVEFTVDKEGKIANIKVRTPHKALENEAIRVVNDLPQMTPGKQRLKPVNVTFFLPITVFIQN